MLNNPLLYIDPSGNLPIDCYGTTYCGASNSKKLPDPPGGGGAKEKNKKLREEFNEFAEIPTYSEGEMIPVTFAPGHVEGLNPDEYRLFSREDGTLKRSRLLIYGILSQNAIDLANQLFPNSTANGRRNAFQHAYWNATLVRHFGSEFTGSLTDAHEKNFDAIRETQFMDLYNNEVGRNIAENNPNVSASELVDKVYDAVLNGDLVVLNQENNQFTVFFSNACPIECISP